MSSLLHQRASFYKGIVSAKDIPGDLPEVTFWGRSNVGKSSLINTILNQKKLVRVSNTPGRTREINYFNIGDNFYITDLPGYGYAVVSHTEKKLWSKLIFDYLEQSTQLKRVYLLIDARRSMMDIDFKVANYLDSIGISYQITVTKIDKLKSSELLSLKNTLEEQVKPLIAVFPEILYCSSAKKDISSLHKSISHLILQSMS